MVTVEGREPNGRNTVKPRGHRTSVYTSNLGNRQARKRKTSLPQRPLPYEGLVGPTQMPRPLQRLTAKYPSPSTVTSEGKGLAVRK